jgi:protein O-mannosyl-transferase
MKRHNRRTPQKPQPQSAAGRGRPARRQWLLLPAFWLAAVLAYSPALRGGLLWDDIGHLTRPDLQPLAGLWRIWFELGATQQYYPMTHSAFWFFHRLWGDATLGYHLANVTLHAASAFCVVILLRRLAVPGAVLAGWIFLLHPVEVESVAWMAELKNALSGVFCLGAAVAYLRFDERRDRRAYAAALALFALALFSKTVTATLPAALLVVFWWKRGGIRWRDDVRPLVPFLALGLAGGLGTAWYERTVIGASGVEFQLGLLERVLVAGRAVWFYLGKIVWPHDLIFVYPRWQVSGSVWWQYLYPASAVALVWALWMIRTRTRAPLAAALLFGGMLSPALGFLDVYPFRYSFVADHFQYLAGIPVMACAAGACAVLAARVTSRNSFVQPALTAVICAPLAFLTWTQSHDYVDGNRLLTETLARNPGCWMCHENLASACFQAGDIDGGIEHAIAALRIVPDDPTAHCDLAFGYSRTGRTEEAIRHYREAIRLRPSFVAPHQYLGLLLASAGRLPEALPELEETVRLTPISPGARRELGYALLKSGQYERAVVQLQEALRLSPVQADVHQAIALALRGLNRHEAALVHYRQAVRLDPGSAERFNDLGAALQRLGRLEDAAAAFRESLRLSPGAAVAHTNLGVTLEALGRYNEAAAEYRAALRLEPGDSGAREGLNRLPRPRR